MGTEKGNRPSDLSRGDRPRLNVIEKQDLSGEDFTSVLLATCNAAPTFAGVVFGRFAGMRGRPRQVSCFRNVQLNGQPNNRVPDGLVELTDRWGRRRRVLVNVERGTFGERQEEELRQELEIVRKVRLDRLVGVSASRPSEEYRRSLVSRWSPLGSRQMRFLSWMEIWLEAETLLDDELFVRTNEAQIVYEFYDFFRRRAHKLLAYQPFGASLSDALDAPDEVEDKRGQAEQDKAVLQDWGEFVRFASLRLRLPMATSWPDVTLFDPQTAEAQLASNRELCARISVPSWQEAMYLALDCEGNVLTMQARAHLPLFALQNGKTKDWLRERLALIPSGETAKTDLRLERGPSVDPVILPLEQLFDEPMSEVAPLEEPPDEHDTEEPVEVPSGPEITSVIVERTVPVGPAHRGGLDIAEHVERQIRAFHVYLRHVMK